MLPASAERIRAELGPDDLVLDIGGWASPFPRANWVMDLQPYETRGNPDPGGERFRRDTWVERDICDRAPYPFADKSLDFVICSHTLEDVRDPVWVCSEMLRIARRGYIEVPSRLEEQTYGFQGRWTGWSHHRWLIDVDQERSAIEFVHKPHTLGRRADHFPAEFRATLSAEDRVQTLWWDGSFEFRERIFDGAHDLDEYTAGYVREQMARRGFKRAPLPVRAWRRITS
jgi:Methionine biosynthesis protein MetW